MPVRYWGTTQARGRVVLGSRCRCLGGRGNKLDQYRMQKVHVTSGGADALGWVQVAFSSFATRFGNPCCQLREGERVSSHEAAPLSAV